MTSAPILPFRLVNRNTRSQWTGASETIVDEDHGLVRMEEERLVVQVTRSRKITKASALGSVETTYEHFPLEEHVIAISDLVGVSLRVPTWKFWESPRVVFHVGEMRILEGLPSTGPAEFSFPIASSDKGLANDFVVRCLTALAGQLPPLPAGNPMLG
jgi:hypothetical protein